MPLRRPHTTNANNNKREDNDDDFGQISKVQASVKSGSNGKGERFNKPLDKPKQPFKPKNYNRDNDNESTQPIPTSSPKNESFNKPRNPTYNRTPQQSAKETEVSTENGINVPKKPEAQPSLPKLNVVPKTSNPEPPSPKSEASKPQQVQPIPKESISTTAFKPASVSDVTPTKKLIPKNYLIEKLSIGDSVILSVEAKASECRITRGDYVCLTMAEAFETQYQNLCEDFVLDCDKDEQPYKLVPGETCSYFNPEDGGWYRARCLSTTTLALLDSGKLVTVTPTIKCRRLPNKYEAIPEFCAVLSSDAVEVGSNLSCKIVSQLNDTYKITMTDVDTNASVGDGEVFRWLPAVEFPVVPAGIPEVDRPPVFDGSKVLLVLATSLDRAFVRPSDADAQRKYNDILQQVLLSAMNMKPLSEPPQKGQMVIGKFTDGNFYRALVRRINSRQNKYQIEYVEYGNIEVSTLENLFPCPSEVDLRSVPTQVSMVKLSAAKELSAPAIEFIDTIKDEEELILTLPKGSNTAPSGSEVTLTIAKNKVNLNRRLEEMCTPEWKKIEERGGDVVETEQIMFNDVEYTALPQTGCTVQVLDISVLRGGVISGYDISDKRADYVFNQLSEKIADYCNSDLGREPYLPKPEELCIAQLPPYPQWFRAVFLDLASGPGSSEGSICYLDYGNIATVPVTLLRKMMPEFMAVPVMGLHLEIRDFPPEPSDEMLARAVTYMKIDDEGRGVLKVSNCVKQADGMYAVDAPELLKVMKG